MGRHAHILNRKMLVTSSQASILLSSGIGSCNRDDRHTREQDAR